MLGKYRLLKVEAVGILGRTADRYLVELREADQGAGGGGAGGPGGNSEANIQSAEQGGLVL